MAEGKKMPCGAQKCLAPYAIFTRSLWDKRLMAQKEGTGVGFYSRELWVYLISKVRGLVCLFQFDWFDFVLEHFAQMKFYRKAQSVKSIKVEPLGCKWVGDPEPHLLQRAWTCAPHNSRKMAMHLGTRDSVMETIWVIESAWDFDVRQSWVQSSSLPFAM